MTRLPRESPGESARQEAQWRDIVRRVRADPGIDFDEQRAAFTACYAKRRVEDGPPPAWFPSAERSERSNLGRLMGRVGIESYAALHTWSVEQRETFLTEALAGLGIVWADPPARILDLAGGVRRPTWLAGARMNIADSCFTAPRERTAVVRGKEGCGSLESVSYAGLEGLVNRVANGIVRFGIGPGSAVALYMPMNLECVAAYLGVIRAGCRVLSIADSFPAGELRKRLDIGQGCAVVTIDAYRRGSRTLRPYDRVKEAGAPRAIVVARGDPELRTGDLRWDRFLPAETAFRSRLGPPDRVTNVLFSSGTTGTPKAVPWTQATPLKCALDGCFHQDLQPGDVVAWPTNIGWMMGPWLIWATLINGATLALFEGAPTGAAFADFVARARVTVLGVVPSLVRGWRASGATGAADWSGLRTLSSTGEPSGRDDYLWLMSRTGYRAPVIEYCGGTEIGGGFLTGTVLQRSSPGTFTTPALGTAIVVLDETGAPVPDGAAGELWVVPPALGLSQDLLNADHDRIYYDGCPRGPGGEELRRHGDRVARLHGGYFKAVGRSDDAMNLGGIKVGALEIEQVLDMHPAVRESAAVAVRLAGEAGDRLVVFVVPAAPVTTADLRPELAALVAREVNPLFKVHDVVVTKALPRTASGKVVRKALRAGYGRGAGG